VALVHQRPDPERRPDRRLRGECMVAIKNFGATGRGAGSFSAVASNSVPKLGKNVEAFGPHTGRREARLRSSTLLTRTVGRLRPMAGHPRPPKSSRVSFAVGMPAGTSLAAHGLEHPHQIVEMAFVQGIARRLTLANSSTISRVRRQNLKGLWRTPSRCHRCGSVLGGPSAQAGPPRRQRSAAPNARLGAEAIPENTRPGAALRWKGVDHLRLLRVLIGVL
jgi:hypothetical protein